MSKLTATENRELEQWLESRRKLWRDYDDRCNDGVSHETERDILLGLAEHLDRTIDKLLQVIRKLDQ
jgi:hypothetical protein